MEKVLGELKVVGENFGKPLKIWLLATTVYGTTKLIIKQPKMTREPYPFPFDSKSLLLYT